MGVGKNNRVLAPLLLFAQRAAIGFFAMLAAPVVQAQDSVVANIPFEFNVGKAVLPSGEYRIKPMNPSTLMIQSKDGARRQSR